MGASTSHEERLAIPLYAQLPFLATDNGSIVQKFTSLRVVSKSFSLTRKLVDAETGLHVFDLKTPVLGGRYVLKTANTDHWLMSYKQRTFSNSYRVYTGNKETVSFEIGVIHPATSSMIMWADFHDRLSGELCRLCLDGNSCDKVDVFYLDRGRTSLGEAPRRGDLSSGRFQPIGRIRTYYLPKFFSTPEHYVEAAPGVDITVLALMWLLRAVIEERSRD